MSDLFPPTGRNGHGTSTTNGTVLDLNSLTRPGRRPGTIRVAMWLLYVLGALMVIGVIQAVWDLATWATYVDRAGAAVHATAKQIAAEKSDNTSGDVLEIVVFSVLLVLSVVSAVFVRRASRAGQILSFVAVAPLMLCGILPFLSERVTALEAAAGNQQPGLMNVIATIDVLLSPPIGIAVVVLLLTPSARAFFRRTPPAPPGYMFVPISSLPTQAPGPGWPTGQGWPGQQGWPGGQSGQGWPGEQGWPGQQGWPGEQGRPDEQGQPGAQGWQGGQGWPAPVSQWVYPTYTDPTQARPSSAPPADFPAMPPWYPPVPPSSWLPPSPGPANGTPIVPKGSPTGSSGQPTSAPPSQSGPPDHALTEAALTEAALTEPALTEPALTEPALTEPALTEPALTEPALTEPALTEPALTEPALTEPEPTDSEAHNQGPHDQERHDQEPHDQEPRGPEPRE